MNLIGDMHMHTLVSGHAYGTIREMAQAAQVKGLEMIGITEHAPAYRVRWIRFTITIYKLSLENYMGFKCIMAVRSMS
jgi:histidinol phosphatase-like PHP family hydrolase